MNERRSHIRRRTFKGGKLIFNKGLSVLDCIIRDMSEHGARVELGTTIGVPDTFELIIAPDRVKRSCKIAWRSKRHIGISFR
jgi:PilZ domain